MDINWLGVGLGIVWGGLLGAVAAYCATKTQVLRRDEGINAASSFILIRGSLLCALVMIPGLLILSHLNQLSIELWLTFVITTALIMGLLVTYAQSKIHN